jgi:hypothetical protein
MLDAKMCRFKVMLPFFICILMSRPGWVALQTLLEAFGAATMFSMGSSV